MQPRPNVLFLISDQHNRKIAGFAGNTIVRTPNLDRLASESAQFDNAYCQFPLCTPSRISMWTGRLPHRTGGTFNYAPIPREYRTIPEHLAERGYVTCGVGKMHVGGPGGGVPMNGFQFRPYGDLIPNRFCGHQPDPVSSAKDQAWTRHDIGHFLFAGPSEIPDELLTESIVTREALHFVEAHRDRPWFVCASYSRPHHPLTAPKRWFDRYWPDGPRLHSLPEGFSDSLHPHDRFIAEDFRLAEFTDAERRLGLAAYYASVSFLDECIGDLLAGLDGQGLLDNTIVVYTSDHGDLASEHGLWWKRSYYDGSAGVPLLIRVPGGRHIRVDGVVELLDLFPTLCDLCGLPTPDDLDGQSLIHERAKDFARSDHIARPETSFRMIRDPRWKYVELPDSPPVLFDMVNDPGEERNIAHLPEYDTVIDGLHRRLWSDGESWESLFTARQAGREKMQRECPVSTTHMPNQFVLPDGKIIDAEEWQRTEPDVAVYIPSGVGGPDSSNQHFNVVATPGGAFLATWTAATAESAPDQRVVWSRSTDRGRTWTEPQVLDGAGPDDEPGKGLASWQFLIVAGRRIWCFYVKNIGIDDARTADTGVLRGRYSDDDGVTWSAETYDYPVGRNAISHPDPSVPSTWIVYQNPGVTTEGAVLAGLTRWASNAVDPGVNMFERTAEVCFLRFENILTESDPEKLVVSTWPKSDHGLQVENPYRPGKSAAQEPTIVSFSDGRLMCIMRTLTGRIYQSLSEDDGRTWDAPRPLLYEPGGAPILHPMAPCPLYQLEDGRCLLLFYNNDGTIHGGKGPIDSPNVRNPAYITVGREIPGHPDQPIRFGPPKRFADTDWTPIRGTRQTQPASYTSLVEYEGERILFYPDRKHFLLGRYLTDEWLTECDPG